MSTLKKTRREAPAVNAGSMADIAFLLLIFFLVTTTIVEDKGVLVRLPEWVPDDVVLDMPDGDVLFVMVNKFDKLLVEDDEVALAQVPGLLEAHVREVGVDPRTRVVSLTHDRGTTYAAYLQVYDALKKGYHTLWDEFAVAEYGMRYDLLSKAEQTAVRRVIPMVISEAEPTEI
ncbi:ExbD/TolR family protein [Neolewinella antarctica]|uniref:Biopolymer transport protein ExbD n=1 Tax=Neolewinella antarctica TaxID=442734 RepID=A0ABX0X814_9BACT|nr:biopolymer transporter ExbD [Neolewinella antarctica]NJC25380.1 biopolymer transport protein ExbD [Neolewinella antarctica]